MAQKNRELSQFGSFLEVDNITKNIGIATTSTPYVGIGTTNPGYKLEVVGDANFQGNLYLNGSPLVDASTETWSISGGDIYRLSGNVGISTNTPTEKLDVSGNIKGSGNLTVSGNIQGSRFISTVASGTAPFQVLSDTVVANLNAARLNGKTAPTGDIVGTSDSQTLTNKTLTLPTFGNSGVRFNGSTSGVSTIRSAAIAFGIVEIPSVTGIQTFVTTGAVGVITSGMIADLSITNADVSTSAAIAYSKLSLTNSITNADIAVGAAITNGKLANSTISGVSLGSTLSNLTAGSFINYSSGTTYNGSSSVTISIAGTSINTSDTVVVRDSLGNFSAATITATDFNSTSDINLKENIETVENSLEIVTSLRGVKFDWKENHKASYGVIAQELEEVLPDLVITKELKTVNYNGLIGVLIEAVKELKKEIEELKKQLNN